MKQTKLICLLVLIVWGGVKNVNAQCVNTGNVTVTGVPQCYGEGYQLTFSGVFGYFGAATSGTGSFGGTIIHNPGTWTWEFCTACIGGGENCHSVTLNLPAFVTTLSISTLTSTAPTNNCNDGTITVSVNQNDTCGWFLTVLDSNLNVAGGSAVIIPHGQSFTALSQFSGKHTVIVQDGGGSSETDTSVIIIGNAPTPTKPSVITVTGGSTNVCPGETRTYTVTNNSPYIFNWTVPTGAQITSGQTTNSIVVQYDQTFTSGVVSVVKQNFCNSSLPRTLTINRNNPTATITTTGPTTFCSGTNPLTLTANAGTGFTYQWKKGSVTLAGATNQNYVPTSTSPSYKVVVTNAPGCSKVSAVVSVTVNPLPAATITPQGPTTFCAGGSVVLQANSGAGLTYQWMKGNGNINSATNQNYTATTAGTYKVKVTNTNTCVKTSAGKVVTVNCREGEEVTAENLLSVFPNPTNGQITLNFASEENQSCKLLVTDVIGREMMNKEIMFSKGLNEYIIDMSGFINAVYLVKLKTTDKEFMQKVVKE